MKKSDEIRRCKNKDCQKILPKDYKHKLCESCRNKRIEKVKDIGKDALGVVGAVIGLAVIIKGKNGPNNKG